MIDVLIISWGIGIIGIIVSLVGGIYFISSLRRFAGDMKKSLAYIFLASFIWILYSAILIVFGFMKLEITNKLWIIIPIAYTATAISYIIGTNKLINLLKKYEKNRKRKQ